MLILGLPAIAAISFVAFGTGSPPSFIPINLSSDPLYATNTGDKPALALALSVEFPTVGAQYMDPDNFNSSTTDDPTYSSDREYLGYYDAETCYTYNNAPATGEVKRFVRAGPAIALSTPDTTHPTWTTRMCVNATTRYTKDNGTIPAANDAFSGNFLNWASSSAIDMLRLSLTGGDRITDTATQTVLQRAMIPDGNPMSMGNSSNFPAKILYKVGTSRAIAATAFASPSYVSGVPYFGAVPDSMAAAAIAAGNKDIYVANTLNRIYFGTAKSGSNSTNLTAYKLSGPTATTPLNSDGYFFARVQVCDRNPTTYTLLDNRYWSLCARYSDGTNPSYKPTGAVQKYSDQLRLAAFGYLMDANSSRYGGVLRAPIKYVGAKTFDINGVENTVTGGNPNREWDPSTGVFLANPDSNSTVPTTDPARTATYLSGVVNYVNQFGRTGSIAGRYKTYDPIGELHYQALRYLQGLQPSSGATSSISTDMYDGYPVFTAWTDPYGGGRSNTTDYSCLKSNIVVIGDKNTWDYNSRIPTASAANNIPDILYWQGVAAGFESNSGGTYVDGAGVTRTISNPNTPNSSGMGSASGDVNIVGSAYWAHTHDIRGTAWTNATTNGSAGTTLQRPGLRVKTFVFDVNEYGGSNDANTRHTSNQLFRAAKYGGFETDPSNSTNNPYNTRGNPFVNEANGTNNNYVWADTDTRPSRVGEANTYFLQSDARGVLSAFDDIFARASTSARSIAGSAIQSKNLTTTDAIYQGTFDTSDWSGDLLAIPLTNTGGVITVGATPTWTASAQLTNMAITGTPRKIIVGNSGASVSPVAVDFLWGSISSSLQTALNKPSPAAAADGLGQDRLNYLRGDKSKEGTTFRTRRYLLGDIINSGVAYSAAPTTTISDSTYAAFYSANASRTPAVFVGANDGMLHAFNGNNGNELFAYIPSWLGSKLSALTSTTYANNHQSYVDGTPVVAEAQVGGNWKTVLVSGTGAGGRGVFALDVTTPSSFTASNVMWEFTNVDDADLGFIVGKPQIVKMRTSDPTATTPVYKYFAMFTSGVDNYVQDSAGLFSPTGQQALFMLDLSKPAGTGWTLGTNYYKVALPVNSTLSATVAPGLLNFQVALGPVLEVAQVYMGDLQGNMWKLDFTGFGTADWNMGKLSYYKQGGTNLPIPMFIAKDTASNVQPITVSPTLVYGPLPNTTYVVFGTGKYLETSDKTSTSVQSVYMVYDNADPTPDGTASSATSAIMSRLRLKAGTSTATTITVPTFTLGRATTDVDTDNPRSGWVFDFPLPKERQISKASVFGDSIIFGSLYPGVASTSACQNTSGGGQVYTIRTSGGSGTAQGSTVGILGEPLVTTIGTVYTPSDSTGRRTKTTTSVAIQQGSGGVSASSTTQTSTVVTGRMSWRQINNYQDLKNATWP